VKVCLTSFHCFQVGISTINGVNVDISSENGTKFYDRDGNNLILSKDKTFLNAIRPLCRDPEFDLRRNFNGVFSLQKLPSFAANKSTSADHSSRNRIVSSIVVLYVYP